MIKAQRLSAIVPSTDIIKTKKFLIEVLEFEGLTLQCPDDHYAIVKTADTELHLQATTGTPNEMSIYMHVESVNNAWEKLKDLEGIKTKAPFIQDYGMKETHVILPHTNTLLFIGEDVG